MAEVRIEDLCKNFGKVKAVDHLNLTVRDGEFVCLLGPSGCGKTTSLRMVAGLETPDSGNIFIADHNVTRSEPKDRDIAMVFENYALYPHMTVFENISYPLRIRQMPVDQIKQRVDWAVKILEIAPLLERYPKQLSGGQRQRVAVGRAIVRQPAVYLMDEPISHLDAKLRAHMRGELKHLQKVLATTTVYVTHDQLEAMAMADRIAVMNLGVLQQYGTPDEVYERPVNMYVAGFIGEPPINFIPGRAVSKGDTMYFETPAFSLPLAEHHRRRLEQHRNGNDLVLGIRPEHLRVHYQPQERALPAVVYVTQPLGAEVIVDTKVGDTLVKVRTTPETKVEMNQEIWMSFNEESVHFFDQETEKAIRGGV